MANGGTVDNSNDKPEPKWERGQPVSQAPAGSVAREIGSLPDQDKASSNFDNWLKKGVQRMSAGGQVKSVGGGAGEGDKGVPDTRQMHTAHYDMPVGKGSTAGIAEFAKGGPVIQAGRSIFMKTPDTFRTSAGRQDYGKKGGNPLANPEGDGKALPPIKPRK